MTIIIFIIVLGLLVLVHELGHFLFAKKAGVRVDEFGFGYPPRAVTLGDWRGTKFSLNWIPFGGFVKILGENYEAEESSSGLRFTEVSKKWQAGILVAGVLFNFLFAWILFSVGFVVGMPTPVENNYGYEVSDPMLTIVSVLPESPADIAGLKSGDQIIEIKEYNKSTTDLTPESVSEFINKSKGELVVVVDRGGDVQNFGLSPKSGIVEDRKVVGINMDMVGTLSLPLHKALYEGAKITGEITYLTIKGIIGLIGGAFAGTADLSQVTGPIGIVGLVGDASRLGIIYLFTFTALISINLAVINLLPLPALDGGRLFFVVIEAVTRRPINPKIAGVVNTVSFALLILLMLVITYRDILKLF